MKTDNFNINDREKPVKKPRLDLLSTVEKSRGLDVDDLVSTCLEQTDYAAAVIYLVNAVAYNLNCNRVSIGIQRGTHTRLSAISNNASFDPKSNLVRHIEAVMDEAIDEHSIIIYPSASKTDSTIQAAHSQFVKLQGARDILTLPLKHSGKQIGAICLERSQGNRFDESDIQIIEKISNFAGPILYILHQEQRSIASRIADSIHSYFANIFGERKATLGAIISLAVLAMIILSIIPANYRITADAIMEGRIQRNITAPVSGYIASAKKRAGDLVSKDELIATLDDKDLALEAMELQSQLQQLQREYREALAMNDRSKVSIQNAKIKQITARQELISEQLSRMKLASPIDGIIIEGDLSQGIGSPVSRGDTLFKIAPANEYRIILKVDESEITNIEPGQKGSLVLASNPGNIMDITVSKITPVSISHDGRTYFRVETTFDGNYTGLQPGMEGVGKINTGDRSLLWLFTHKVVDRLRLLLWRAWI